jgi:hypothetical protein
MNTVVATSFVKTSYQLLATGCKGRRQTLHERSQHALDLEHQGFRILEVICRQVLQIPGQKQMVFHLICRASSDLQSVSFQDLTCVHILQRYLLQLKMLLGEVGWLARTFLLLGSIPFAYTLRVNSYAFSHTRKSLKSSIANRPFPS